LYSDLVLLAVPFNSNKSVRQFELDFALYEGGRFKKRVFLLLVHEQNGSLPQGTEKWLEERDIELCLHYRKQHARDTRRIGRILARKAVGLVLGGGGGKGFAHVGAVKALLEAGIEIDFLGGSSAGALYGLNLSYIDFDMERAEKISKESAEAKLTRNDFQFPVVSLMTGKKLKKYLQVVLGDSMLEDFWTNTYCVSTDYSTASAHVIRTGLAWKQIAASIAIPGIYPPVIIDNHLHLDGGLMDNVPIGPMYDYPVGQIISVVLSKHIEKELDIDEIPGSWTLLRDRFLPGKKKYHLPGIASILMNSLILNSHNRLEEYKEDISIYLELDLKGVGMLDDSKWKEMIEKGYVQMKAKLDSITEEDRFWV
jgi:NTE family protein